MKKTVTHGRLRYREARQAAACAAENSPNFARRKNRTFFFGELAFPRFGWYIITLLFVENKAETRWKRLSDPCEAATRVRNARPDPFENTQSC